MLTRGDFLKVLALIGAGTAGAPLLKGCGRLPPVSQMYVDQVWNGQENAIKSLTRAGATEVVLYMDSLADQIEKIAPEPPANTDDVFRLAVEIIPYFIYEGIRVKPFVAEVIPDIKMGYFGGESMFHVMGRAACWDETASALWLNLRFFNQYSPFYGKSRQISTLVHELGHSEGICFGDVVEMETATQLATLEVLAAMVRHGNKYALLPFIREAERFADDYVMFDYLREGDLGGYRKDVVSKRANHEYAMASFEKSMEYWIKHWFDLLVILQRYGVQPHILLTESMNNDGYWTRELPYPNPLRKIAMDDTAYVLGHLEQLVHDFPLLLEA